MNRQSKRWLLASAVTALALPVRDTVAQRFEVTVPASVRAEPITGRLIVAVSKREQPEPRFLIAPQGPAIYGMDLEQVRPGHVTVVDGRAVGYPMKLSELPSGDYFVQALVIPYERVRRSDGHVIWLHMNDGTIEPFNAAAGTLHSGVQREHIERGGASVVKIEITKMVPAAPRPADTEWIKRVSIQSTKLTQFWGRPVFIHAHVLLPKGYAEHPNVSYPSIYSLGHSRAPFNFSTTPSQRPRGDINPVSGTESGYDFYQSWIADDFPRVIAISLEQQTPYFPDSYSVNSANNGPYGDAIVEEIIPALEERFRIIRKPYARQLEGASTSGWQSLALLLRNPDFFGGAWVLQPDPIDFRRYQQVNVYEDTSAFTIPVGQFITAERPFRRTLEGQPVWTVKQLSNFEDVLGSRGRAQFQLEGWEAVFGPVGADGYPVPLWDKQTGKIDRAVATYWREHGFDLRDYTERNWATLGPKLAGKLHFFAGDMDDFYLNLAVYRFEEFLKGATSPTSDAEFVYGRPMKGHSWHVEPWAAFVRRVAAAVRKQAPAGEQTTGWSY
jgi:putative esterase